MFSKVEYLWVRVIKTIEKRQITLAVAVKFLSSYICGPLNWLYCRRRSQAAYTIPDLHMMYRGTLLY